MIKEDLSWLRREEFDKAIKYFESLEATKPPHYWFPVTIEEQAEYCRSVGIIPVMVPQHLDSNVFEKEYYCIWKN